MFEEKGNVALGHGPRFGAEGHGFARRTSPELVEEIIHRPASAL